MTQTPLLLRDERGGFGTATRFRVALREGGTRTIDAGAAGFDDLDDFLEHNRLPATWTLVHPAGIRPGGDPGRLLRVPARASACWRGASGGPVRWWSAVGDRCGPRPARRR